MAGGTLQVEVKRASGLPAGTASRLQLELSNAGQGGTAATPVGVGPAPQWDQQFTFPVAQWTPAQLRLSLLDAATGAVLGTGSLPLGTLPVNRPVPREVPLQGAKVFLLLLARDGAPSAPPTRLSLSSGGSPQTSVGPASDVRPVSHRSPTAPPPAVSGDSTAGSAMLELKVTSAKGLDSLPPCACCVRVSFGAWAAHTLVLPSHQPTLWNETFALDAGQHGPVGEVVVVDVESGACLATGSVDLREVAWGDAERCMHSVVVATSNGRTVGTVNLILRGAVGLLQGRWAPSPAADPAPVLSIPMAVHHPASTPSPAPPTPAAVLPVAAAEPSGGRRASTPSSVPHRSGLPPAAPPATSLPAGGVRALPSPYSTGLSSFQPSVDLTSSSTSAVFEPSSISLYPPISGFPATALLSKQDHATTPSSEPVATRRLWGGDSAAMVPPPFCHATPILRGAPSLEMTQPPPPPTVSPAHAGHRLRLSRATSPHLGTHTVPVRPATPPAALTPATGGRAVDLQRGGSTLTLAADLPLSGRHTIDDGPKRASTRPTVTPGTQPPADPWEVDWDYIPPAPPTTRASRPTPATLPSVSASPLSSPTPSVTLPTPPHPAASSVVQKTAPPLPTMATRLRLSRTRNAPPGPTVLPQSLSTPHHPAASPRGGLTSPDPSHGPLPSHRSAADGPPCDPQPPPDAGRSPECAPALEVGTSPTCASSATWGLPTPGTSAAEGLGDDTVGWLPHCLAAVAAMRPALTVIASALHWAAQTPLRSATVHGTLLLGCHSGWALRLTLVLSLGMLAGADAAAAYRQRLDAGQRRTIQRAVDGAAGGLRRLLVSIARQSPGEWPAGAALAGVAGLLAVSGHLPLGVLSTLGASLLVGLLLPLPEMDPESEGNDEVSRVRLLLVLTIWFVTTGLMDPVAATAGAAGYLSALPFSAALRTFPDPATLAVFLQPLSRLPAPDPPHICHVNPLAMGSQ